MLNFLLALNLLLASPNTNRITTSPSAIHRATAAARVTTVRKERIRLYWGTMVTRIEAAIARLEKLIARMETRIGVIKASDTEIDTSVPEKDIADAKVLLAKAKTSLQSAKDELEAVLTSETPKEAFTRVIDTVGGIKKNLTEAHKLLVHAIGAIKGLRVGQESPTPTPTPSP